MPASNRRPPQRAPATNAPRSANGIPFDTYPIFKPGGIRVGTPAVTTRGMKEEEMLEIADLVAEALAKRADAGALEDVRKKVLDVTSRFPLPV